MARSNEEKLGLIGGTEKTKSVVKGGLIGWGIMLTILIALIVITIKAGSSGQDALITHKVYDDSFDVDQILSAGLGKSYWLPLNTGPAAIDHFQLGVRLLHLFWYDEAAKEFEAARTVEPDFALGYWGEAMCMKQSLWGTENVTAAQAILAHMDANIVDYLVGLRARAYLKAVRVLFAANTTLEVRERGYSAEMQIVMNDYPTDPDPAAFYALSLIGMVNSVGGYVSTTEASTLLAAARSILTGAAATFPAYAGILHYTVQAYDYNDLSVAEMGKSPSIQLGFLAPVSNQALHMKSHIFLRFGDWAQVIDSNTNAVAASDTYCARYALGTSCDADNRWHALEWLLYGLINQCKFAQATLLFNRMQFVVSDNPGAQKYSYWLYRMFAHLNTVSQLFPAPLSMFAATNTTTSTAITLAPALNVSMDPFNAPHAEAYALMTSVYVAVMSGMRSNDSSMPALVSFTVTSAQARLVMLNATCAAVSTTPPYITQMLPMVMQEVSALGAMYSLKNQCAAGMNGSATTCASWRPQMEAALITQRIIAADKSAPHLKIAPVMSFYGNMLLTMGQDPSSARALFTECLAMLPNQMACVLGMARSSVQLNDLAGARTWYTALKAQAKDGDILFPGLVEAAKYTA